MLISYVDEEHSIDSSPYENRLKVGSGCWGRLIDYVTFYGWKWSSITIMESFENLGLQESFEVSVSFLFQKIVRSNYEAFAHFPINHNRSLINKKKHYK